MAKRKKSQNISILIGLAAFLLIYFGLDLKPGHPEVTATLAMAVLMAIWWVTEAVPIAITSLLPIALFPFFNIMPSNDVAIKYFNSTIFLYIAGFMMAFAMEKWNLHRRIALKVLVLIGISPGRIILGFMLATAFLSMWMSNTATTVMMIPIVISIIGQLEESVGKKQTSKFVIGLLLAIAYSATVGGISTLIGTPPNLVFAEVYKEIFPTAAEISFSQWFVFAFPLSMIMLAITWVLLVVIYKPKEKWKGVSKEMFKEEVDKLGKPSFEEKIVFVLFSFLALLWMFRTGIQFDNFAIPGWSSYLKHPEYFSDGNVGISISIILFMIPSKNKKGIMLMDWASANKLPWNIVLLFGGGFALAAGFKNSGLSMWFAEQLIVLEGVHPLILIFVVVLLISLLTELTSNVATTQMFLPVLASMAVALNMSPLLLMVPATIAASLAFMLPIATPPNAIVFGTERISIMEMAKTGLLINLIKVVITTLFMYFIGVKVFSIAL